MTADTVIDSAPRVLLLLDSLALGGTEWSTAVLARGLTLRGVEVTVVCLRHEPDGYEALVRQAGVAVSVVVAERLTSQVRAVRRIIRFTRPAVIHTALARADLVGRLAAVGGPPVISSLVSTPYVAARYSHPSIPAWKLHVVRAVDALTGRFLVDRFHAVSSGVAEHAVESLRIKPERITVIERGRDDQELGRASAQRRSTARAALGLPGSAPVLLAVGRHEPAKGFDVLLDAFARLRVDNPDLTLLLAGREGSTTADLRALASLRRIEHAVRWLGHRTDVPDLLAAADAFVLSSRFEGTAGVVIEAFALEVPVVATELLGLRGILRHLENAVTVPPQDPVALASGVQAVLDDPELSRALGQAGRREFEQRFGLEAHLDRMLSLYRAVVAPQPY